MRDRFGSSLATEAMDGGIPIITAPSFGVGYHGIGVWCLGNMEWNMLLGVLFALDGSENVPGERATGTKTGESSSMQSITILARVSKRHIRI
jgi:hypothetical protein